MIFFFGLIFNLLMYFWKHNKYCDAPLALLTSGHGSSARNLNNLAKFWCSRLGHPIADTWSRFLHLVISLMTIIHIIFVVLANIQKVIDYFFHYLNLELFDHPLALVRTDLWDLDTVISTISPNYFLLFLDFSRFSSLHPLHTKDQALPTFVKFKTLVENQFNSRL